MLAFAEQANREYEAELYGQPEAPTPAQHEKFQTDWVRFITPERLLSERGRSGFPDCSATYRTRIQPVSYTHLDVYKRQIVYMLFYLERLVGGFHHHTDIDIE